MSDPIASYLLLGFSALVAGAINAIAGGGTLFTFSALLTVVDPVTANATSTVALVPGSLAGAWGYRQELHTTRRWTTLLIGPCVVGGVIGSLLVTELDEQYFVAIVPWLLLTAALLFLVQPAVARLAGIGKEHRAITPWTLTGIVGFQFIVAVYGGYFGAGIGILMLSALGLMGFANIHQMNALKTILAACINGVSVVVFVAEQKVEWRYALSMAITAIVGGYLGARIARRLDSNVVRWVVVLIGLGLAAHFFYQQWRSAHTSGS
ncbi:MAG TPA: sulfite exporter TauE/SafE family protein [Gemmataceae bacterium]|nr:sulfite exporter TauE/SafE family protein [Gemmataceae bacterium]